MFQKWESSLGRGKFAGFGEHREIQKCRCLAGGFEHVLTYSPHFLLRRMMENEFKPVEYFFLNSMAISLMWFGRRTAMKR